MIRTYFICMVGLFFSIYCQAQSHIKRPTNEQIIYTGKIVDSETGEALPFSQINHIYKLSNRDSMIIRNIVADKDGKFEFHSPRVMDNRIEIICLGYKILTRIISEAGNKDRVNPIITQTKKRPEIYNHLDLGILKLIPDVQQLEEVEVKVRLELFKREGDTLLVFPKNIKQLEGDALIDLIKRHPSFRVDEQGNIYVDGKKIERAMLNNKHIFGEDVKTMVHSIMAKEAGLIKVYDEIDETSEILKGKEFARKRKVMNVITFKDFNKFKGGDIYLEGGTYADKNMKGKQQTMHDVNGKIGQYATNFRISAESNSKNIAFPQKKEEIGAGINSELSSTDLLKSFKTGYNYSNDEQEQTSLTQQFYFPTSYFESQIIDNNAQHQQNRNTHKFALDGKYIKKSIYSFRARYSGVIENSAIQTRSVSNINKDEQPFSYLQQTKTSNDRNYNHDIHLQYTPSFNKFGSFDFQAHGIFSKISKESIRMDTSRSGEISDKHIFNISENQPNSNIKFNLTYNISRNGQLLSYMPSIHYVQSNQLHWGTNCLSGSIDSVITYDNIQRNLKISNRIQGSILSQKFTFGIHIYHKAYTLQLEEKFPQSLKTEKKINSWDGGIYFHLLHKEFRSSFEISDSPFPINYLSTRLRDDNPMNLSTGNPNLKMGKSYTFSCDFQIRDIIQLNFRYKVTTNSILSSRRYFETNTILPEYGDYEALAGAVLITPINANNYNSFDISAMSYSKRGAILVRGELNHTFENPEVDLLGKIVRSYTHRTNSNLSLLSNFSHTFRLDITNQISCNYSKIKAEELQKNNWINNRLICKANLELFYRMMINADYTHNYSYNSQTRKTNNSQTLNASINYRIFSDRRGLLSINAYNLLNTKSSLTTTSTDLYIQNAYRPENSTLITISFRYKFGVEQ